MNALNRSMMVTALCAALQVSTVSAQTAATGPKIAVQAITQVSPTIPQYTQVDQPMLRDGLKAATNGRVEITLSYWPERNVNCP